MPLYHAPGDATLQSLLNPDYLTCLTGAPEAVDYCHLCHLLTLSLHSDISAADSEL